MLERKATWLIGLGSIAFLLGISYALFVPREPNYEGESLSTWVQQYGRNRMMNLPDPVAEAAIRNAGRKALPFLVAWIDYDPSPVEQFLNSWVAGSNRRAHLRTHGAEAAFGLLATEATVVLPELTRRLHTPRQSFTADRAARSLANIGEQALPILNEASTNENSVVRSRANYALFRMGTNLNTIPP